jgi:hypothetical protein
MTRKDYAAIAATLRTVNQRITKPRPSEDLGEMIADILQHTFPNFDRKKFIEATKP